MTTPINTVDDLARFLVAMHMGAEEALSKLLAQFPDADADGALSAAMKWKADRDSKDQP